MQQSEAGPTDTHANESLTIYTTGVCGDCVAAKRALDDLGVAYHEVRLDQDEQAISFVERVNHGRRSVPTLAYGDRATSLSGFSPRRLREFLSAVGLTGSTAAASGD